MKKLIGSLLLAAMLPACFNNQCQKRSKASVTAALLQESQSPFSLRWDERLERPTRLWGDFRLAEKDQEKAVRAFLQRHKEQLSFQEDLRLRVTKRGKSGSYLRFSQMYQGLPVFGGEVVAHLQEDEAGLRLRSLRMAQKAVTLASTTPKLSEEAALSLAKRRLGEQAGVESNQTLGVWVEEEATLVYRVQLSRDLPPLAREIYLDANTGEILRDLNRLFAAEGVGLIYDPSPVGSTGDTSLLDQNDTVSQALSDARIEVPLPGLDGSGFLRGRFVDAKNPTQRAQNQALSFFFERSDDRFEEVMAYFHIDRAQSRIQALGIFDANNRVQEAIVNGIPDDNSFYSPFSKRITYGTGGVDDAEDADIIVHEYGHSIQDDQVPGYGLGGDEGAMGEGFSDYLAGSFALKMSPQISDPACIGDWDAVSFDIRTPPCLRRLDEPKHFPETLFGEVHADGELWSASLFEVRQLIGADVADALFIEAHFAMSTDETYESAAEAILATDQALFGGQHQGVLTRVFTERGILRSLTPPANLPVLLESIPVSIEPPREPDGTYASFLDHSNVLQVTGAAGLRLTFSVIDTELNESCFEGACDNIYLYDKSGNLYQILNGTSEGAVVSVVIPGDQVRVRLVSDVTIGAFGYRIAQVDVLGAPGGPDCGDGAVQAGEQCDGSSLSGADCTDLGFSGGSLSCRPNCTFDASECTGQSLCGNGQLDQGEECDGANIGGTSCDELGFDGGLLSCNANCTLNTAGCSECGDGLVSGSESCDGLDLGGFTCESVGLLSGFLRCSGACTFDTSACITPVCQ